MAATRHLFVAPWECPAVHFRRSLLASKVPTSRYNGMLVAKFFILDHVSQYEGYTPVFTDSSKDDAGVDFGDVLPSLT